VLFNGKLRGFLNGEDWRIGVTWCSAVQGREGRVMVAEDVMSCTLRWSSVHRLDLQKRIGEE
jgi:hypothetical protein